MAAHTKESRLKVSIVVGFAVVCIIFGVAVLRAAIFNATTHHDLTQLAAASRHYPREGRPLVSIDQLAIPDDVRLRAESRGYVLQAVHGNTYIFCAHYYANLWSLHPTSTQCAAY